jgi:hypothetical protein
MGLSDPVSFFLSLHCFLFANYYGATLYTHSTNNMKCKKWQNYPLLPPTLIFISQEQAFLSPTPIQTPTDITHPQTMNHNDHLQPLYESTVV